MMGKKFGILIMLFLFLYLVENVGALSSDLKEKYSQRETMIVSFSGQILEPISFNQVEFLRGHVKIPLEYDIKRVGEKYYLWAITPENEGNYSLVVRDVVTFISGTKTKYTYIKNFSVGSNKTDYNIKPGFVISDKDFSINVFLYEDFPKKISLNFPKSREVTLEPGSNKIDFSIENSIASGFLLMKVGSYNVPIEIISNKSSFYNDGVLPSSLFFEPYEIKTSFNKSSGLEKFSVKLMNKGKQSMKVSIQYNETLFKVEPTSQTLKANQTIEITIQLKKKINESLEEKVMAVSANETAVLPVYLEIIKEKLIERNISFNTTNSSQLFCSQLLGVVCEKGSVCKGESRQSRDGTCCLGVCEKENDEGSSKAVSFLIFGVVILIILVVWFKYKKSKKVTEELIEKNQTEKNKKIP